MKKYSWLFVILGVVILGFAFLFSAALGAGIAYFFLQASPVQAAFAAPVDVANDQGVLIAAVDPDSPAAEAGLVRGDIILDVNGVAVNNLLDLRNALSDIAPGETVDLTVLHGDDTRSLTAELGDNDGIAYLGVNTCGASFGGSMIGPSGDVMIKGLRMGAVVTEVIAGSPAEEADLQVGDLILSVDGEKIGPKASLADLIQSHEPGDKVSLEIQSADTDESREVEVTLDENPDVSGQAYLGVAYQAGTTRYNFEGSELPFMETLPFGELPEGFEIPEGMPHFFFHGEDLEGELPEGWSDSLPHFFTIPQLPEGVDRAVIISEVMEGTPAEEAGLQPNDLILAVDGDPVTEIEAFVDAMQSHKPGDEATLTVFRDGEQFEVKVTLAENPDDPSLGYLGVLAGSIMMNEKLELPEGSDQDFEFDLPGVSGGDA